MNTFRRNGLFHGKKDFKLCSLDNVFHVNTMFVRNFFYLTNKHFYSSYYTPEMILSGFKANIITPLHKQRNRGRRALVKSLHNTAVIKNCSFCPGLAGLPGPQHTALLPAISTENPNLICWWCRWWSH